MMSKKNFLGKFLLILKIKNTMYLKNIKLWNFRKFGDNGEYDINKPNLSLNFTKGLNVLIGENDSGKTAIIDAIKIVLKTHAYEWIKIEHDDFFDNSNKFRIEILFEELNDDEAKHFTEWLTWNGTGENAQPTLKIFFEATKNQERIISTDVKAGSTNEGTILTSEARDFLKVTYLKPLRDAKNELIPKKNSRLAQIFQEHEAFKGQNDTHLLVELFKKFNEDIKKYFEGKDNNDALLSEENQKGKELKSEIDKYLKSFYDNSKETDIKVVEANLKNILEKLELLIKDEKNIGLGTLNRLFMASELLHLNKRNYEGLRLGLIEELEAHLHPQAQMQVIESLQNQENIQLILTTHSPNLASKVKLENLIICSKSNAFPLGRNYTKLKTTDYPYLERFLDVTKSNLFFSKGVIFVEGISEEIIIPSLTKILKRFYVIDKDLTEAGVSVISIGNTSFLRYSKIFQRVKRPFLEIPVSVITDLDLRPQEYSTKYNIPQNKRKEKKIISEFNVDEYLEIKKKGIENQFVKVFISSAWTLEYCIALHPILRKTLYKAIIQSNEELRADSYSGLKPTKMKIRDISELDFERKWEVFSMNKSNEEIAFQIMYDFIENKKTSKSIISLYFSKFLENDINDINQIMVENNPIEYLINAIKYACNC